MKRTRSHLAAIISAGIAAASVFGCAVIGTARANAATRPRYGGVLHVEMRERANSMDPRDWITGGTDERLLELVFERLVSLDDAGQPQPALAVSWTNNANFTHWEFALRQGVKFHDGTALSAAETVIALKNELPPDWNLTASGDSVVLDMKDSQPQLLEDLATKPAFIFSAAQDTVFGTGPFRIVAWTPQRQLALVASDDCWQGRPFVDRIEIALGVSPQQQLIDLDLRKADVVELPPSLSRRVTQASGARVWASAPVDLYELVWNPKKIDDRAAKISHAVSAAIDRSAIVNVLLQGRGEPAGGFLPQWLSGYAFVFPTAPNLPLATEIRAQISGPVQLSVVYDGDDPSAGIIAQRVALNARDAGITMNVRAGHPSTPDPNADVTLMRWHFSVLDPLDALNRLAEQTGAGHSVTAAPATPGDRPQQAYALEQSLVYGGALVPIAFVPELYALGPQVRDWMPAPSGGWRLADVWLDTANPPVSTTAGSN
jgi:ABC-type transport system substrate-binding protein